MASITLENVSVDFPIYGAGSRSVKMRLLRTKIGSQVSHERRDRIIVHALRDVSLSFRKGDRIGFVGSNGAGKSTLLRTIAGIYEPFRGAIEIRGRVNTLFDINVGIETEATGFENITLRGLACGMTRREIDLRAGEIAEFTELGEYLNFPIYTYSTGMRARLAFAISTTIKPEILLMDEWIGTGDKSFIEKARARMFEVAQQAGILVLASHNKELMRRICNKIVVLNAGRVESFEPAEEFFKRDEEMV